MSILYYIYIYMMMMMMMMMIYKQCLPHLLYLGHL